MSNTNGQLNNNNVEDVRSQQRQRVRRQAFNQMQQLIEIEREETRKQKNERQRLRRQQMTDDQREEQRKKDRERKRLQVQSQNEEDREEHRSQNRDRVRSYRQRKQHGITNIIAQNEPISLVGANNPFNGHMVLDHEQLHTMSNTRKQQNERQRLRRQQMTDDQREEQRKKDRERKRLQVQSQNEEDTEEHRSQNRDRVRSYRQRKQHGITNIIAQNEPISLVGANNPFNGHMVLDHEQLHTMSNVPISHEYEVIAHKKIRERIDKFAHIQMCHLCDESYPGIQVLP